MTFSFVYYFEMVKDLPHWDFDFDLFLLCICHYKALKSSQQERQTTWPFKYFIDAEVFFKIGPDEKHPPDRCYLRITDD